MISSAPAANRRIRAGSPRSDTHQKKSHRPAESTRRASMPPDTSPSHGCSIVVIAVILVRIVLAEELAQLGRVEDILHLLVRRSEERRVGKECVSRCHSRVSPFT